MFCRQIAFVTVIPSTVLFYCVRQLCASAWKNNKTAHARGCEFLSALSSIEHLVFIRTEPRSQPTNNPGSAPGSPENGPVLVTSIKALNHRKAHCLRDQGQFYGLLAVPSGRFTLDTSGVLPPGMGQRLGSRQVCRQGWDAPGTQEPEGLYSFDSAAPSNLSVKTR